MCMGLASASAVFQRLMSSVLAHIPNARCFIDDILVASASHAEHEHDLRQVFDALRAANITVKPAKCAFGFPRLKYLGFDISAHGVSVSEDTPKDLRDKPPPDSLRRAVSAHR